MRLRASPRTGETPSGSQGTPRDDWVRAAAQGIVRQPGSRPFPAAAGKGKGIEDRLAAANTRLTRW